MTERKTQMSINGIHIPLSVLMLLKPNIMKRFKVIPIASNPETIVLVAHELSEAELNDLAFLTGKKIIPLYTDAEKIEELLSLCPAEEAELDFQKTPPMRKEIVPNMVTLALVDGIFKGVAQIKFEAKDNTPLFYFLIDNVWHLVMAPNTKHTDWFLEYFRTLFPKGEKTGTYTQPTSKRKVVFNIVWETEGECDTITFILQDTETAH